MIKVKDGYAKLIGTTYQGSATQVLLSNGGDLEYSASSKASTLVQRNASQHIYATYFNSAISDEALTDIGSVYVRNTSDTFIRRVSKTQFYSILDDKFVTLDTTQSITGAKTFSTSVRFANNASIIQNQNDTSNYTTILKWYKNGASRNTYDPSIGQHNTGGDGNGSICILPYPTETSPWGGMVGLFISKGVLKLDGKSVALAENYYTKTESDERYVNVTGDTMTGPLIVKAAITGTQLISTIATGTSPLKVTSTTVVTNLNSDLLDGYHANSFIKIVGTRFSQYQQGTYTKILEFTITSGSLQPSITFTWHPSECARDVWADFSINIRSSAIIFHANWKGAVRRSLWCVGNGTTYSVWVSGTKSLWDPYGVVQVMSTWGINTYKVGSLQYADTAPSGTYSATAITSGWASRVVGTLTMTAGKFSSKTYNGSADVAVSIPTHFSHLTNDNKNLVIKFNGGTTEGTNMFTYNGSTAKSPNITLTAIGSGLLHNSLTVQLANTTTDSGWSMINSSYNGFILKSIRTQASAPSWILGNYSAGICFGGADTKGVISCAYNTPSIRFAGGNSSKPVWWMGITGSSGATYNLANMWTGTRYWANVAVSTASSTSTQPTFNTCYTSNWFRSTGNTGWYSESYGGGWCMTDSTWIRTYGSKSVYQNTGQIRTDGYLVTNGGITVGATSPNNGTYKSHVTGNSWSSGYIRAGAGFYHNSVNSNNYVLLAGGSYKSLADFAKGNAGASNRGVYVTNGTVTAMTYYLNATINSGASGKLAYYSGTNSIDDYTNTIGSSSTPIYINNGIPNAANSYKVVNSGHYFSAFGISGYIYVIRYGQVVCVSINMSSGGNGSTGTTTLLTNLPSAVYTTGQSASKGGGSALRQATFYVSGTTLYVYSYQADQLPNKVSFTYITNTLE